MTKINQVQVAPKILASMLERYIAYLKTRRQEKIEELIQERLKEKFLWFRCFKNREAVIKDFDIKKGALSFDWEYWGINRLYDDAESEAYKVLVSCQTPEVNENVLVDCKFFSKIAISENSNKIT